MADEHIILTSVRPENRTLAWREFRESLSNIDEIAYDQIISFWGRHPQVDFYVDFDDISSWPTPWEIITNGQFCPTGMAICIFFTLLYSRWDRDRLDIRVVKSPSDEKITTIVVIDDKIVLNYHCDRWVKLDDLDIIAMDLIVWNDDHYVSSRQIN
ncbi:MAG: hypothetical protein WC284_17000 [Candidimonas sp.]